MNILVTGAGLIGCHGAKAILDGGHGVVLFEAFPDYDYIRSIIGENKKLAVEAGDLRDLPALIQVVRKHGIDTVVHTAGLIGKKVAEHPYTGFTVNVQGTMHVAETVRVMQLRRLIFVSSFGAYNWAVSPRRPVSEDYPLGGEGLYGATKAANEHLLEALADLGNFELLILRPAGVFGRGHFRGGSTVGIIMNDLVGGAVRNEKVRLPAGLGTNEYVYVKDVAQAIEKACTVSPITGRAFNVGTGILHRAEEFIQEACKAFPALDLEFTPLRAGETVKHRPQPLDISRARTILGYEPRYPLEKALKDYGDEIRL